MNCDVAAVETQNNLIRSSVFPDDPLAKFSPKPEIVADLVGKLPPILFRGPQSGYGKGTLHLCGVFPCLEDGGDVSGTDVAILAMSTKNNCYDATVANDVTQAMFNCTSLDTKNGYLKKLVEALQRRSLTVKFIVRWHNAFPQGDSFIFLMPFSSGVVFVRISVFLCTDAIWRAGVHCHSDASSNNEEASPVVALSNSLAIPEVMVNIDVTNMDRCNVFEYFSPDVSSFYNANITRFVYHAAMLDLSRTLFFISIFCSSSQFIW